MRDSLPRWPVLSGAILFVALHVGCAPSNPGESLDPAERQLRLLHRAYEAATIELKRSPRKAEEIEPFLPKGENVLISLNDGQPFVVFWRTNGSPEGLLKMQKTKPRDSEDTSPILAHEKIGTDKGRCVIRIFGETAVLPEEQFQKSWFARRPKSP